MSESQHGVDNSSNSAKTTASAMVIALLSAFHRDAPREDSNLPPPARLAFRD